ncbi:hypothetical protein BH09MYX1_BH09MYX1_03470 [soil metagenome]
MARYDRGVRFRATLPFVLFALPVIVQCSSTTVTPPDTSLEPLPGEQRCDPRQITAYELSFDPAEVVTAPGVARPVRVTVDPDACVPSRIEFTTANAGTAPAPLGSNVDLRHATYDFNIVGGSIGKTIVTAHIKNPDGTETAADLSVDVRDPAPPSCTGATAKTSTLALGTPSMAGDGALADATLATTANAFVRQDMWTLPTFDASIGCGTDLVAPSLGDYAAISPPVDFEPKTVLSPVVPLRRELDFTIPVNPAAVPPAGRLRHLVMLFSNAKAKTPRPILIASPRIEQTKTGYVLHFSAPWFGTYQAVMPKDAGTRRHKRGLQHRSVIGFSMGGAGAASFGFRHHDKFDVIAPMGGPSDWSWLLWFVESYALGGFCPSTDPTCVLPKTIDRPIPDTLAHPMDFNHWWYEKGSGNGGHFPRDEYTQIFADLALMEGNPNGENTDPEMSMFAAGVKKTDPYVVGDVTGLPPGTDCRFPVEPLKGPDEQTQDQIKKQCAKSRCDASRALIIPTGYFDDEYNPDGQKQVISFCEGGEVGESVSPYSNTWRQPTADEAYPMNLALAVDLNKNGIRDENEPVIRSGHEPYDDFGEDGLADAQEPGYDALTNPDPNQDDYDPQLNATGTEGDHRYQLGEPFKDVGLDGVPNTKASPYDTGEGDGKYTEASGLSNFYSIDPHSIIRGWSKNTPKPFDDEALRRMSIWSDGGVRDLFNFGAVSTHLTGALSSRKGTDGRPLQQNAMYNGFHQLPGQDPTRPDDFAPSHLRWADIANSPSVRYGTIDATPVQIDLGDGMHVGTAAQILYRIEAAFYYSAHQWTDADRLLTEITVLNPATTTKNELGLDCEKVGKCEKIFTGPTTKRTGPIAVTLPPGYALEENRLRNVTYPVIYVLHGYGQDPRDLEALAIISNNFMNDGLRSYPNRLAKFITVYVDGRCRTGADGKPECIQGSFYLDSHRPNGPLFDSWFDEVTKYVDDNYRTMAPSEVEVTE